MKPDKLFIGALVQNPLGGKGWVRNIRYITEEDGHGGYYLITLAYSKDGGSYSNISEKDVKPIPITPEILEKLGFKKDTGGEECWACKSGWFTPHHYNRKLIPTSWEVQICQRNSFSGVIKYVHELQAAMKLCKIKKGIAL